MMILKFKDYYIKSKMNLEGEANRDITGSTWCNPDDMMTHGLHRHTPRTRPADNGHIDSRAS